MNRRTYLLGAGTGILGGVALFGSGAFSSVTADREATVRVVGDGSAWLTLSPGSGDPGGFVTGGTNGPVSIDVGQVTNSAGTTGEGANQGSVTAIDDILRITNQGSEAVSVSASFPAGGGVVLFRTYSGPNSIGSLDEAAHEVSLPPGASDEVGIAVDAGYHTSEIPGTIADGDTVQIQIVADAG